MKPEALQIHAGPRALARLRERGLRAEDVRVIPAAAGGAKGITLNPLDRFLFGHWLPQVPSGTPELHLLGASIGAWRMAAACRQGGGGADAALAELAEDYITQQYAPEPGRKRPSPGSVSRAFGQRIEQRLGAFAEELLAHPRFRLHVFTSRGRHVLARQGRLRTPLGYAGAFFANALHRRALGGFIDRVVFEDTRQPLPLPLQDFRSHRVPLMAGNLVPAVLASCSIPFWLDAVHDVPGGPRGAYWDGGITDYHLHLDYRPVGEGGEVPPGIVLYPHFQPRVVPGWLDKPFKRRHRASSMLDDLVVLSPAPHWVASLPNGKLPDRNDFMAYAGDDAGRMRDWRRAVAESQCLADEFAEIVTRGEPVLAQPLP
jgi:hypothetical protein